MKKIGLIVIMLAVSPLLAFAEMSGGMTPKTELGIDVEMPYSISVDGDSTNERGDTTIGVHSNYFIQPAWSVGLQFDYGVETQAPGADNALILSPGTAWHFMPGETWSPYVRGDIPMYLAGGGSSADGFDFGLSTGAGIQWNMKELTGVSGLALKYDFALNYFFDAKAFSINMFRFAFSYLW